MYEGFFWIPEMLESDVIITKKKFIVKGTNRKP